MSRPETDAPTRGAADLVAEMDTDKLRLTGDGGILLVPVKELLQLILEIEMDDHLGYRRSQPARRSGNHRNGAYPKTVLTEMGPVTVAVPRDRAGTFEPRVVPKNIRHSYGFASHAIDMYTCGTVDEIESRLRDLYNDEAPQGLAAGIVAHVQTWQNLQRANVYPLLLIEAIRLPARDRSRTDAILSVVGVDRDGHGQLLGLWRRESDSDTSGEPTAGLAHLRARGVIDVDLVCCERSHRLSTSVHAQWPTAAIRYGVRVHGPGLDSRPARQVRSRVARRRLSVSK